jgi:putative restriction endonuclease
VARVLLQPRGSARVHGPEHFDKSVRRGLQLGEHREQLTADQVEQLAAIYGADPVRLWGSTPTDQVGNEKATALRERRPGDVVLFYADGLFIAQAQIAYLFQNPSMGRAVWGVNDDNETWEHLMALTDVEFLSVPSEVLLTPLGISPVVRGLRLLNETQSAEALRHLPGAQWPRR